LPHAPTQHIVTLSFTEVLTLRYVNHHVDPACLMAGQRRAAARTAPGGPVNMEVASSNAAAATSGRTLPSLSFRVLQMHVQAARTRLAVNSDDGPLPPLPPILPLTRSGTSARRWSEQSDDSDREQNVPASSSAAAAPAAKARPRPPAQPEAQAAAAAPAKPPPPAGTPAQGAAARAAKSPPWAGTPAQAVAAAPAEVAAKPPQPAGTPAQAAAAAAQPPPGAGAPAQAVAAAPAELPRPPPPPPTTAPAAPATAPARSLPMAAPGAAPPGTGPLPPPARLPAPAPPANSSSPAAASARPPAAATSLSKRAPSPEMIAPTSPVATPTPTLIPDADSDTDDAADQAENVQQQQLDLTGPAVELVLELNLTLIENYIRTAQDFAGWTRSALDVPLKQKDHMDQRRGFQRSFESLLVTAEQSLKLAQRMPQLATRASELVGRLVTLSEELAKKRHQMDAMTTCREHLRKALVTQMAPDVGCLEDRHHDISDLGAWICQGIRNLGSARAQRVSTSYFSVSGAGLRHRRRGKQVTYTLTPHIDTGGAGAWACRSSRREQQQSSSGGPP